MKTHKMNLLKMPYTEIKEGRKNVEMRLYDEKRRKISVGDRIIFSCDEMPGEKIYALVENTYIYEDFRELSENYSPESLGFACRSAEYISDYMLKIYSRESVEKYGAFAIEIALEKIICRF